MDACLSVIKARKKLECHSTECQDLPSALILQRVVELELYPIQMPKYWSDCASQRHSIPSYILKVS